MYLLRIKSWIGRFLLCCPPWVNFQKTSSSKIIGCLIFLSISHLVLTLSRGGISRRKNRARPTQTRARSELKWKTCCLCYRILILTSRTIRSLSHRKNDWCASPSSEWRSPPPCSASPQSLNIDDCNTFICCHICFVKMLILNGNNTLEGAVVTSKTFWPPRLKQACINAVNWWCPMEDSRYQIPQIPNNPWSLYAQTSTACFLWILKLFARLSSFPSQSSFLPSRRPYSADYIGEQSESFTCCKCSLRAGWWGW